MDGDLARRVGSVVVPSRVVVGVCRRPWRCFRRCEWERGDGEPELLFRRERVRRRVGFGAHVRDADKTGDASAVCGWLIGSLGIVAYTQNGGSSSSLLEFVREHRSAVWVIGPMFASFTGLAFKEGACYGKPEAFLLFLLTPIMCLGHLTGLASDEVETFFVASWMLGFLVFAGRKYTQAVKDDIGDKSVFTFRGLKTDEERRDYLERQGKDLSLMEDAM